MILEAGLGVAVHLMLACHGVCVGFQLRYKRLWTILGTVIKVLSVRVLLSIAFALGEVDLLGDYGGQIRC